MALYHFHVTQIKRSEGRTAVASAAYRAGEKLHNLWDGETHDYTRKGGVILTEIILPEHAPKRFFDRSTLWNEVEQVEKNYNAQLAYSFDMALQNEFSLEENIELAREFVQKYFVSDGMIADLAIHKPDRDEGGIPNPHFHVLVPIRPLNADGTWGAKQRREYHLDENGNRIKKENGQWEFDAVPTTNWGKPETLDMWRQAWADMVNDKFREKGLECRIDHRSYVNLWDGETHDYTRKGGVILTEIILPEHAPKRFFDRSTLWNEVEQVEKNYNAQLAYSFDMALQNEFSLEENIELAREFVQKYFVSDGMIADLAIHKPDRDEGGIPNPHFHVLVPIRPLNADGTWGAKQRREYHLDENGNRIKKENGQWEFDAVPTTNWGKPETLDMWRQAWADMVNDKFREKGLECRIDHRSYVDQGLDLIPTVHEGPQIRKMEKKGIRTEKGELNRWIKATNRMLCSMRATIVALKEWIQEAKEILKEPQEIYLVQLLSEAHTMRNQTAMTYTRAYRKGRTEPLD